MENASLKNRNLYWDNIKGILILLVVFAHFIYSFQDASPVIDRLVDYIYMFHMPAFVFVSGYFGKGDKAYSFERIIKLVFLYFIFNSLIGFYDGFVSLLYPMYSYWYLLGLIVWRLTAHHIAKFRFIIPILFVTALAAGFYSDIDNTFAVCRIIGFYPFYMMGYKFSKEQSGRLQDIKYPKRVAMGLGVLLATGLIAVLSRGFFAYSDLDLMMYPYQSFLAAPGRVVLFVIAVLAILVLLLVSFEKNIPFFTDFGANSIWVYVLHRPIVLFMSRFLVSLSVTNLILVSLALSFLICMIFGSFSVRKYLDRFLDAGVEIFVSDKPVKISFSLILMIFVYLLFIVFIFVR